MLSTKGAGSHIKAKNKNLTRVWGCNTFTKEPIRGPPSSGGLSRSTAGLEQNYLTVFGGKASHRKYGYIKSSFLLMTVFVWNELQVHTLHRLKTQLWNSDTVAKSQKGTTCLTAGVRRWAPLSAASFPNATWQAETGAKHTSIVENAPHLSRKSWRKQNTFELIRNVITSCTHVSSLSECAEALHGLNHPQRETRLI